MGRGSWLRCDCCDGAGHIDYGNHWDGGRREDCDVCDGVGVVELPLSHDVMFRVLERLRECEGPYLTDGWECVREFVEGTCDHCRDLAAAEYAWMAPLVASHRKAGHRCNPYGAEPCSPDLCPEAWPDVA